MAIVRDRSTRWQAILAHVCLIAAVVVVFFPLLMIISISFRQGNFAAGQLIPKSFSLEHWKLALGISYVDADGQMVVPQFPVLTWIWNSLKVSFLAAALCLLLSTSAAYAFARMRFRGRGTLVNALLLFQMYNASLTLVAIYTLFDGIGESVPLLGLDSHWSLVLVYIGVNVSLQIWLIKGYYDSVPRELEEAAAVDGATRFQAFVHILLPMAAPILAVAFALTFLASMIEYPIASVLMHDEDKLTLAIGSRQFLLEQRYLWGDFAASAILAGLPLTLLFLLAQKWVVSGLTAGALKD